MEQEHFALGGAGSELVGAAAALARAAAKIRRLGTAFLAREEFMRHIQSEKEDSG